MRVGFARLGYVELVVTAAHSFLHLLMNDADCLAVRR